eukprot:Nitzschia sp. Nitz4//scaffold120_size68122//27431//28819//NITZ4_006043-RA/size68122-processed-gene-0.44-mRNA-1//-1//CDS//3329534275//8466//frame0
MRPSPLNTRLVLIFCTLAWSISFFQPPVRLSSFQVVDQVVEPSSSYFYSVGLNASSGDDESFLDQNGRDDEVSIKNPFDSAEGQNTPVDSSIDETRMTGSGTTTCVSHACVIADAEAIARVYPFKHKSTWIIHGYPDDIEVDDDRLPNRIGGIILVKNYKAASSTSAGLALRLNDIYGNGTRTWVNFNHVRGSRFAWRRRDRSIMFTSVRDPASRSLSRIFYTNISRRGRNPNDSIIMNALKYTEFQYGATSHDGGGFQVRFLSMDESLAQSWNASEPTQVLHPEIVRQNVRDIINEYDFIMVAERMDESLVAFALLMDLRLGDVLVNEAKSNTGGLSYVYYKSGRHELCKRSVASFRSPLVKEYLESDEWRAQNYGDYLLVAAANRSLDLTIDRLGRSNFEQSLSDFRALKQSVYVYCENRTVPPCASNGTVQTKLSDCYANDFGCGYPCVDEYLEFMTNE